jgi:hypothetical protein
MNMTNFSGQSLPTLRKSTGASDPVAPSHYKSHPSGIEAIEITQYEDFLIGNVFKYLLRRKFKGQELTDVRKALWYLTKEEQRLSEQEGKNESKG